MNIAALTLSTMLTFAVAPEPPADPQGTLPSPRAKDAPATGTVRPSNAPPTLDELLGLPPSPSAGESAPPDPNSAQLDDLLKGEKLTEAFEQATKLMSDVAKRLGGAKDAGIDTQRLQEDIIKKLEQVLDGMQQQQNQQSSSKSKPQRGEQQPEPQSAQGRSRQQQQQQSPGENKSEAMAPERQDGTLRPGLEGARAAWGSLPERVRDMLLQGAGDRFSSKYQGLTEAYYRKLAEDKDKK